MSIFDIHFAKPQDVTLIIQNHTIRCYAPTPKPFLADGKLDPHFTDFLSQLAKGSLGIQLDPTQYEYYIGTYDKKNKRFEIPHIVVCSVQNGALRFGYQNIAEVLKASGREETCLGISALDIRQLKRLDYHWV